MRLPGRKADKSGMTRADQRDFDNQRAAIAAFWAWWPSALERITPELVAAGLGEDLVAEIGSRVEAIDKSLGWELGPHPAGSGFQLVVTARGVAGLRAVAQRWAQSAPADPDWRYLPAQPGDPGVLDSTLSIDGGRQVALTDTEIAARVDQQRALVDVVIYHPVFGDLADEQPRTQIAMLTLDWLLGEDDVERWVGTISTSTEPPLDGIPAKSLPMVVEQLAAMYAEPRWALLSGSTPTGLAVVATVRFPMRRVDYPLCDQHLAVVLPYRDRTEQRLPAESALDALRGFEEELLGILGESAVLVGHESANGRRIMHAYADRAAPVAEAVGRLAQTWPDGRAQVAVTTDPSWTNVAHLRP